MASVDSRLIDTSQMAREGSAIFIRSQQVRDLTSGLASISAWSSFWSHLIPNMSLSCRKPPLLLRGYTAS
jgi:hypothetical protein